jgi:group I intron endonuclease
LNAGKHHSAFLQNSWKKHGKAAFSFEVLELIPVKEHLIAREQFWIDALGASKRATGFNIAPMAGSTLGMKCPGNIERAKTQEFRAAVRNGVIKSWTPDRHLVHSDATRASWTAERKERLRQIRGNKNHFTVLGRAKLSAKAAKQWKVFRAKRNSALSQLELDV